MPHFWKSLRLVWQENDDWGITLPSADELLLPFLVAGRLLWFSLFLISHPPLNYWILSAASQGIRHECSLLSLNVFFANSLLLCPSDLQLRIKIIAFSTSSRLCLKPPNRGALFVFPVSLALCLPRMSSTLLPIPSGSVTEECWTDTIIHIVEVPPDLGFELDLKGRRMEGKGMFVFFQERPWQQCFAELF